MSLEQDFSYVLIPWVANPFRGDKFEEAWLPAAAAAPKYGARGWAFTRSSEDKLAFMQYAVFENKMAFDRYWLSDEIAGARAAAAGLYQVPILPVMFHSVGFGLVSETLGEIEAA